MKKKGLLKFFAVLIVAILVMIVGLFINSETLHKSEKGMKDSETKIAYVIGGSKGDTDLYSSTYDGIMTIVDEISGYLSMRENIGSSDLESNVKSFIDNGFNVFVLCGDGYDPVATKLADENPDISFIVINSQVKNGKNLGSLYMEYRGAGFIRGVLAGHMTKRNVVAAIGYTDDRATLAELYGFEKGARFVNNDIQVYGEYVTKRGGDATAASLFEEFTTYGADIVISVAGSGDKGVFDVAESKGLYALAGSNSYLEQYPETVLAVSGFDITGGVRDIISMVVQEGFNGESIPLNYDLIYNEGLKARVPGIVINNINDVLSKLRYGELDINKLVPME